MTKTLSRLGEPNKVVAARRHDELELYRDSFEIRQCETGGAVFDRSGRYRYLLWRELTEKPDQYKSVLLIMLNPNKADERSNDPTIRRCISFARSWGFDRLNVVNLFAARAQTPAILKDLKNRIGTYNDDFILKQACQADLIVLAWGNHGSLLERDLTVLNLLGNKAPLYCLGKTKSGNPRHPLYISSKHALIRFDEPTL